MSTTEETLREAPQDDAWCEEIARTLDSQRERARQMLAERRARFGVLHSELSLRIAELADELSRHETASLDRSVNVDSRETSLKQQADQLAIQQAELRQHQDQWEQFRRQSQERHQHLLDELQKRFAQFDTQRAELATREERLHEQLEELRNRQSDLERNSANLSERQQHLDRKEEELTQQRTRLEELQRTHKSETEQLSRNMAELNQIQVHFDQQRQALAEREREIARQRRNVARQLRARKKELATEKELLQTEARSSSASHELQLQQRLSELQGKYERACEDATNREQQRDELTQRVTSLQARLEQRESEAARLAAVETQLREVEKQRDELARNHDQAAADGASRDAQVKELNDKIKSLTDKCAKQAEQLAQAQTNFDKHRQQWEHELAKVGNAPSAEVMAELAQLRSEKSQLEEWLREAESKAGAGLDPAAAQELADLKQRLEMAMQDCRDLRNKNADLQRQFDAAKASAGSAKPADGGMDWESQKRRMLAQLEADFEEGSEEQQQQKLSIEEAILKTEQAIAAKQQEVMAKDQEIEELRRLLDNQASNIGDVAVGAAAIAGVLDQDELIRQERESLKKLQDSLRDQLRQAEIELSVERAKVARERAEMEEKIQSFEMEKSKQALSAEPQSADGGKKGSRGRWLARLGLRDDKG